MAAEGLVGRWRLVSWSARTEGDAVTYPFGERAEGSLVYTTGGWMAGTLLDPGRALMSTDDVVGGTEAERAAAFSTYVAYCGMYEVEGDVIVHRVQMSLFPNWVGSEQKRYFELSGDELVLRAPPVEVGGRAVVSELRWIREE
jgi:hypothetical protein